MANFNYEQAIFEAINNELPSIITNIRTVCINSPTRDRYLILASITTTIVASIAATFFLDDKIAQAEFVDRISAEAKEFITKVEGIEMLGVNFKHPPGGLNG